MRWDVVMDLRTQTLAVCGRYAVRWIGRTFYLYVDGRFAESSPDVQKLSRLAASIAAGEDHRWSGDLR